MSNNYNIIFTNNSSNPGSCAVFQQDPNIGVSDVFSLAWFSKYTYPTTKATFTWTIDYNFVWSETGPLSPGVTFVATQDPPTELGSEITLHYDSKNGAYYFSEQTKGPSQNSLYIDEGSDIPLNMASVGIGMSGSGTFVVQAQPNMNLTFTPHPSYWVVFGTFTQGQVLDIRELTHVAHVPFEPGVFTMYATLNQDNSWTISSASEVNRSLAIARQHFPEYFARSQGRGVGEAALLQPGSTNIEGTAVPDAHKNGRPVGVQAEAPAVVGA